VARDFKTDAGRRTRIADFSENDLAEVIADAIKVSERRMIEHTGRLLRLVNTKVNMQSEKRRVDILFHRVMQIESELRRMARKT
jgi:hypothetical protein